MGEDFIVSELLSELKAENERKSKQITSLYKVLVFAFLINLLVVAGFLWYLNQYDFSSTETVTETITNTAEGIYAVIDSEGNVISSDLTAEEIQNLLEGVLVDGNGQDIADQNNH